MACAPLCRGTGLVPQGGPFHKLSGGGGRRFTNPNVVPQAPGFHKNPGFHKPRGSTKLGEVPQIQGSTKPGVPQTPGFHKTWGGSTNPGVPQNRLQEAPRRPPRGLNRIPQAAKTLKDGPGPAEMPSRRPKRPPKSFQVTSEETPRVIQKASGFSVRPCSSSSFSSSSPFSSSYSSFSSSSSYSSFFSPLPHSSIQPPSPPPSLARFSCPLLCFRTS